MTTLIKSYNNPCKTYLQLFFMFVFFFITSLEVNGQIIDNPKRLQTKRLNEIKSENRVFRLRKFRNEPNKKRLFFEQEYSTDGKILKTKYFGELGLIETEIRKYDDSRNIIKLITENDYEQIINIFEYDENNTLKVMKSYNADNELAEITNIEIESNHTTYNTAVGDSIVEKTILAHDTSNSIITMQVLSFDDNLKHQYIYKLDEDFRILEEEVSSDSENSRKIYTYDERGNEIESKIMNSKGELIGYSSTKYHQNNLINEVYYYDGTNELKFHIIYEYEYFQ